MKDNSGRQIDYLRISLTDRCNLRCQYCMPESGIALMKHEEILSYEEIIRIVEITSKLGIKKIRLTGGEPLLRKGVVSLVKSIKAVRGIEEVAMTTNGLLLEEKLDDLLDAGLDRINLSMDTLNHQTFEKISRYSGLEKILSGLQLCLEKKVPVKINTVAIKGINDMEIMDLIKLTYKYPLDVRFIELMPIGCGQNFQGLTRLEIISKIEALSLRYLPVDHSMGNGPSEYIRLEGALGKVGFISPMSHKFCNTCNRIRITPEGFLKPCLFSDNGIDLKTLLREGISDADLKNLIASYILKKPLSHHFDDDKVQVDQRWMIELPTTKVTGFDYYLTVPSLFPVS